jgi:hypothetical protein
MDIIHLWSDFNCRCSGLADSQEPPIMESKLQLLVLSLMVLLPLVASLELDSHSYVCKTDKAKPDHLDIQTGISNLEKETSKILQVAHMTKTEIIKVNTADFYLIGFDKAAPNEVSLDDLMPIIQVLKSLMVSNSVPSEPKTRCACASYDLYKGKIPRSKNRKPWFKLKIAHRDFRDHDLDPKVGSHKYF